MHVIQIPHRFRVLAAATSLLLVASACGSDDESAADAQQDFTGEPIKVMTLSPFDTETLNAEEPLIMAEGAVKAINAEGGINGRELQLISCNEGADPNQAAECARQAVAEEVVAVIGGFSTNGSGIIPILEDAGIAWIGPAAVSPEEFTSPISYPLVSGGAAYTGLAARAVADGCESIGLVRYDVPAAEGAVQLIAVGLAGAQRTLDADIKVPPTTTDFASLAQRAGENDCVIVALPGEPFIGLVAAGDGLGVESEYYAVSGALDERVVASTGGVLEGTVTSSNFAVASDSAWDEAKEAVTELDAADWSNPYSQATWVSYQVFRAITAGLEEVTAASVIEALDQTTDLDTGGLSAPLTFSQEFAVPGLNRVFNRQVVYITVEDGKIVQTSDFEDMSPLFGG